MSADPLIALFQEDARKATERAEQAERRCDELRTALRELSVAFTPKIVPLDVDENGAYEEATTRWGGHPVYEAALQALVEAEDTP